MRKAIYALSGDPIHNGHIDIVKRTAKVFDEVILAIGTHPDKCYLFSREERMEMARRSLSHIINVEVVYFEGLLVDYAYEQGISVIVKGVRNSNDFDYENILHLVGESQELGIDTYFLFARPELVHVSSSTVKALQKEEGCIHHYVPLYVKQCLEARISGQYILGITGEIGSGKSRLSELFGDLARERDIEVHTIELDTLGNQILEEREEPSYHRVRERIVNEIGHNMQNADGTINRKNLGEIIYRDYEQLNKFNQVMEKPLIVRLRRELRGKRGLILINAALMAESKITYLCNNNVILVRCDKSSQERRIMERGFDKEQIRRRLASQYSEKEKREKIQSLISQENQGNLWIMDDSDCFSNKDIAQTFDEIVEYFRMSLTGWPEEPGRAESLNGYR